MRFWGNRNRGLCFNLVEAEGYEIVEVDTKQAVFREIPVHENKLTKIKAELQENRGSELGGSKGKTIRRCEGMLTSPPSQGLRLSASRTRYGQLAASKRVARISTPVRILQHRPRRLSNNYPVIYM
ncbi:hypothetical protein WA026_023255 [Henosepilachna vigintioctopunctata]|uniref:Uncharacterized protein n=1 Tax=Henosepilachna vigintioctopunctata TaxID=420089 RepID=A0AAW1V2E2_9CUCU